MKFKVIALAIIIIVLYISQGCNLINQPSLSGIPITYTIESNGSISLDWADIEDIDSYSIYKHPSWTTNPHIIFLGSTNESSFNDISFIAGYIWKYTVVTMKGSKEINSFSITLAIGDIKKIDLFPLSQNVSDGEVIAYKDFIYYFGGRSTSANYKVLMYSLKKKQCYEKKPIPGLSAQYLTHFTATLVYNSVYIIGGIGDTPSSAGSIVYKYNLDTDSWTMLPSIPNNIIPYTNLEGLYAHTAVFKNGLIYIFGGVIRDGASLIVSNSIVSYNPFSGEWKHEMYLPSLVCYAEAIDVEDYILLIGGSTTADGYTVLTFNNFNKYYPSKNNIINDSYISCVDPEAVYLPLAKAIIFVNNINSLNNYSSDVKYFSLDSSSLGNITSQSLAMNGVKAVFYNGCIFLLGGYDGINVHNTICTLSPYLEPLIIDLIK